MTLMRRSRIIKLCFSIAWFMMSLSYLFGAECLCCSHTENHVKHHEKTDAEKCCSPLDDFSEKCQCQCISCSKSKDEEIVTQEKFISSFEKDELAVLSQLSSDTITSISEQKETHYQHTTFPLKFLSLYLIKESFLL